MSDKLKTILLVEDEAITAMLETEELRHYGYNVVHVLSGEKAVDLVCRKLKPVDLILMDIDLGQGIDGTVAAREILKSRDVPIVFLSSHTEPEIVEKTEKITSYGYVVKNAGITVLDASIKMAFNLHNAHMTIEAQKRDLNAANEELQAAIEELETKNEQLIESERTIQISEERYRHFFDNSGTANSIFDTEGRLVLQNSLSRQYLGAVADEAIGKSALEIFDPSVSHQVLERIKRVTHTRIPEVFETEFLLPGGTRWFRSSYFPVFDSLNAVQGVQVISQDITERKRAEEALLQSEDRFRTLTNVAPVGIYLTDGAGKCMYANERWLEMAGLTLDEALGDGWIRGLHPDDRDMVFANWQKMVESQGKWGCEYHFKAPNGRVTDIYGVANKIIDNSGNISGYIGVNMDITERKRAENELRESEERFRVVFERSTAGILIASPDGKLLKVNKAFADMLGYSPEAMLGMSLVALTHHDDISITTEGIRSALAGENDIYRYEKRYIKKSGDEVWADVSYTLLLDDEGYPMYFITSIVNINERKRAEEKLRIFTLAVEESSDAIGMSTPDGRHYYQNKAFDRIFGDIGTDPPASVYMDERIGHEVFNAIMEGNVINREVKMRGRTGDVLDILLRAYPIKDNAGLVIGLVGVHSDITDRKMTEDALKESHEKLSFLLESSLVAISSSSLPEEIILDANNAFCKLVGRTREDVVGHSANELGLWANPEERANVIRAVMSDGVLSDYEVHLRSGTGKIHTLLWSGIIVSSAGKACLIASAIDITDRKEAEAAFKGYFNMGTVGMCVTSLEKGWIEVNDRLCAMLEYSREELKGMTWAEITHPEDLEADVHLFNRVLEGEIDNYELEKRFLGKSGKTIDTLLYVYCKRNPDGSPEYILASLVDITERKHLSRLLVETSERLSLATDSAQIGIWDWDTRNNQMVWNDHMFHMYGVKDKPASYGVEIWVQGLHPDDREATWAACQASLRGEKPYDIEFRVIHPDGSVRFIKANGLVLRDADSNPIRMIGVNYDVTDRKKAKIAVQQLLSEKELVLKEVHHRIKNNMATIMSLMKLQAARQKDVKMKQAFLDAAGQVSAMLVLYDKLYKTDHHQALSLRDYLTPLVHEIVGLLSIGKSIKTRLRIQDISLHPKVLSPIGIIVNELLTNAVKYAFPDRADGMIMITADKRDGMVTLTIQDDGVGLPESVTMENPDGFGLLLVKMLVDQLQGSVKIERSEGTGFVIKFSAD